jgi:multisubunit Na+/H+ antiporter MnhE subunit
MAPALLWVLILTAVYALTLGSFAPWDVALGALVATVLVASLGRTAPGLQGGGTRIVGRLLRLPPLAAAVLRDMTLGTWQVASVVLGIRPLRQPGIVAIPIDGRSDAGVLVTAFLATLAPGEFLVEIDWEERVLLFHVLDASDAEKVRSRFADFYLRHQQRVVP